MITSARPCCGTLPGQHHLNGCVAPERPARRTEPTTPGPEQYVGEDAEMRYLVERWDDGSLTLATRPRGGARWSAPVRLVAR